MSKQVWIRVFLLIVGLSILAAFVSLLIPKGAIAIRPGDITPSSTGFPSIDDETVVYYQTVLAGEDLDEGMRRSLEEKLRMAQWIATQRANSMIINPDQAVDSVAEPRFVSDPVFQEGIFDGDEGIFRPEQAVIQNYWQGELENSYLQVFAGALGSDADQGIVYILETTSDRLQTDFELYLAPQKSGSLQIIGESDFKLILLCEDQTEIIFDILKREFIY
ncbi:MAG: hypothetical protein MUO76_16195 [Anaerolineaceae bacterium]|nr:hypothetical protein [Anaerolineaceae bacterium]